MKPALRTRTRRWKGPALADEPVTVSLPYAVTAGPGGLARLPRVSDAAVSACSSCTAAHAAIQPSLVKPSRATRCFDCYPMYKKKSKSNTNILLLTAQEILEQ